MHAPQTLWARDAPTTRALEASRISQNGTDAPAARVNGLVNGVREYACGDQRKEPPTVDESSEPKHRFTAADGLARVVAQGGPHEKDTERGDETAAYPYA